MPRKLVVKKLQSITIKIYNSYGAEIVTIAENRLYSLGIHRIDFNSAVLSSGVYYCALETGGEKKVIQLIIIK